MALLFADGFDFYTNLESKWTYIFQAELSASAARNGPQGLSISAGGNVAKSLPLRTTIIAGYALKLSPGGSGIANGAIYQLAAVDTNGQLATLFTVQGEQDGSISIYAGNTAGSLLGNTATLSPPFYFTENVFYYVEWKVSLGGGTPVTATGSLKVNGRTLFGGIQGPTAVNSTDLMGQMAQGNYHIFGSVCGGGTSIDDLYINDDTAVDGAQYAGTFRGDIRVGPYIVPRQDSTIEWTPLDPGSSYSQVNAVPPVGDSAYVYDYLEGDIDTFYFTPVPSFTGEIQAAHANYYLRKDNEGTKAVSPVVGGTVQAGAPTWYISDEYQYYTYPMDVDPAGAAPWTTTEINNQVFGAAIVE
jgi:hypothetical protein